MFVYNLEILTTFNFVVRTFSATPKFMTTFPYPYMNGRLHLGHTFTLSKCEVVFFLMCYFLLNVVVNTRRETVSFLSLSGIFIVYRVSRCT